MNIFDQVNTKFNGELKLCPCNDIQVIGYSKQLVEIVYMLASLNMFSMSQT